MKIKIKKLNENAVIPKYAKNGDAGLDLVAVSQSSNELYIEYGTGLALEIPEGYVGLIFPRSSISKYHLSMANSVGVVDSGYRGEVTVRFKRPNEGWWAKHYEVGDKIAQLVIMPYPQVELVEVTDLSETERGAGGYGSSGT
jgi:dUTP pyrophosphatase